MFRNLYTRFIEPRLTDPDLRSRELILNTMLATSFVVIGLATTTMTVASIAASNGYMAPRIFLMCAIFATVAWLYWRARRGHYWLAAISLVVFYVVVATMLMYIWGTRLPVGVLLCGLNVVLAGILLGARSILYGAAVMSGIFLLLRYAEAASISHPRQEWLSLPANMNGAIGVILVIGIIAAISWLFNYQMERSLRRARAAEVAIIKQNEQLEQKVQERTRELQKVQLQKMQQLYRFAELGQLSTALLHDLANQLTVLSLDIEDLEPHNTSLVVKRAKQSIKYIDSMVQNVREQLEGKSDATSFSTVSQLTEVIKVLARKAQIAGVDIIWQPPKKPGDYRAKGDPVRLRQMITNIVSNAIEASERPPTETGQRKEVHIVLNQHKDDISISIKNWGKTIPQADCERIFEPFFSRKKSGMGMGLYIAKHIAEDYFGGTITLSSADHTEFIVTIPQNKR